jgi:hypothetical protein
MSPMGRHVMVVSPSMQRGPWCGCLGTSVVECGGGVNEDAPASLPTGVKDMSSSSVLVSWRRGDGTKLAKITWVIRTFDTDGEVIFPMASILTHQVFQGSTKHQPCVIQTLPSVSLLVKRG